MRVSMLIIMFKNSNGMTKEHSLIVVKLSSWLLPLPALPALPSLTAKCISKYNNDYYIIGMDMVPSIIDVLYTYTFYRYFF